MQNNTQWNSIYQFKDFWKEYREPVDRLSWDEYFILQAYLVSTRSLDAQTQCGCVLVKNKAIIGAGYNSHIHGIEEDVLPNIRKDNAKYPFMIHSEHNAILNCVSEGISTKYSTAYITGVPCNNCFQYMYRAGISRIVYPKNLNIAVMTVNDTETFNRQALRTLIKLGKNPIQIDELELSSNMIEKINQITSVRL